MSEPVERVDIPCGGSALAAFRAFRAWAEQVAASQGKTLDPAWYEDAPEGLKTNRAHGELPDE